MARIKLLLNDDVEDLGRCGDVVQVAPGYARNFLLPQGFATVANAANQAIADRKRARLDAEQAQLEAEYADRVAALEGVTVETEAKADGNGHLFGSVSAAIIAELLTSAGYPTEESNVRLPAAIKSTGEFTVKVHLHAQISTTVQVVVLHEGGPPPPPVEELEVEEPVAEDESGVLEESSDTAQVEEVSGLDPEA